MEQRFESFEAFYPYYLKEHQKKGTRVSHFIGTSLFFLWLLSAVILAAPFHILYGVATAYFFAWIGHFFIEKNKPATFKYPLFSLRGDFRMYFDILKGKEGFEGK
jgi:hypothetical protein